jgi:hypothetical protein
MTESEFAGKLEVFIICTGTASKDLFDSVWKIVQECGEAERHFNQLQSVYRGIASSWLLATFGAAGYLEFKDNVRRPDIAALVCLLGALGVALLWILDMKVYYMLLEAFFNVAKDLEKKFDWLPQVRSKMVEKEKTKGFVRRTLAWYYLITAMVPVIGGIGIVLWGQALDRGCHLWDVVLISALVALFCVILEIFHSTYKQQDQQS